jgi:3',5'-cyclic AMP phosphodiesterase CpdA
MTASIAWIQVGDLHADEEDGWLGTDRLRHVVAGIAEHGIAADFLFLPGDNANHGTIEQYDRILDALAPLALPWRVIPGDHDFEPGDLDAYKTQIPEKNRPKGEIIAGYRCIFLDIVSAGAGGPDFRLPMGERRRLAEELARAAAEGTPPIVFMHAYPGDLAADGPEVAETLAAGRAVFVGTGHTHYNELLNDGRVIYGAARSTAQIEEGGEQPGLVTICVHDGVPSWRFRPLDAAWPAVQIVAPCDVRLVTRPTDPLQVPRPGEVRIVVRSFGATGDPQVRQGDQAPTAMRPAGDHLWEATLALGAGLQRIEVEAGAARNAVDVLVRPLDAIPKRGPARALGEAIHAIGAWPEAGLLGTQLGPNRNGGEPWKSGEPEEVGR